MDLLEELESIKSAIEGIPETVVVRKRISDEFEKEPNREV